MNRWTQLNIWPNRINNCRLSIALLQLKWPKWPHLCRYIRSSQYSSYTHSHSLTQFLPNPNYIHSHFISNWRKCAAKCNTHIFWIPLNPQNNSKERNDMIQQKMLHVLYWFQVSFIAIIYIEISYGLYIGSFLCEHFYVHQYKIISFNKKILHLILEYIILALRIIVFIISSWFQIFMITSQFHIIANILNGALPEGAANHD